MRRGSCALFVAAVVIVLLVAPARAIDEAAGQERLGVRAGYIETFDGLHASHGTGWDLTLFFSEQVYSRIVLDIRLGAIYLGDALNPDLDDRLTRIPGILSEMRVLYFSVGPMAGMRIGASNSAYVSAGIGVYSVSIVFDSGFSAFDTSDQHVGFNGGIGVSRRIAMNWSIEANATIHYFSVGNRDLYYLFTDGADSPVFAGVAIGATVDLR